MLSLSLLARGGLSVEGLFTPNQYLMEPTYSLWDFLVTSRRVKIYELRGTFLCKPLLEMISSSIHCLKRTIL